VTLGPGDLVASRYELVRMLGGGDAGRVYLAYDRHLAREVALRFVEAGDPTAAETLLDEGRRMARVQFDCPQAIAVLDAGEIPGGGAYTATELIVGSSLEEVALRRAPLPVREASRYAIELLDACLAARHHEQDRTEVIVGSALVTSDRHIRVTRFRRAAGPGPEGADPAVAAVAETLRTLLAGGEVPPGLQETIDDATSGRLRTADALRARLMVEGSDREREVPVAPLSERQARAKWPWIVAIGFLALLVAAVVAIAVIAGGDDGDRVTVPDVTGQKAADAVDAITSAGLKASTAGQVSTTVTKGIVISTSPSGGDEADAGSSVTVTVSQGTGTVAVPVLLGLSQADATAELTDAGLKARVLQASSDSVDKGAVISQDPAAGLQIDVGSTVAITVSTGPAPVAVPDVSGRTVQEASQLLQQAGLVLGAVTQETSPGLPAGEITDQDPGASERVPPGTAVDVTVAEGGASTAPG